MSITKSTIVVYEYSESTNELTIPFDYLKRDFVVVALGGDDKPQKALKLGTDYRFATKTTIVITRQYQPDEAYNKIIIKRVTDASKRIINFQDGSILNSSELNVSQLQALHVAEEARDLSSYTLFVDNDGNLNARGRKIINLGNPSEASKDAVNVTFISKTKDSILEARDETLKAKEEACSCATNAKQSELNAKESEEASTLSKNAAKVSEQSAQSFSESASSSASKASQAMSSAQGSATNAINSEKKAKASEINAAASAKRAEDAADKAVGGGIPMVNLKQETGDSQDFVMSQNSITRSFKEFIGDIVYPKDATLSLRVGETLQTIRFVRYQGSIYDFKKAVTGTVESITKEGGTLKISVGSLIYVVRPLSFKGTLTSSSFTTLNDALSAKSNLIIDKDYNEHSLSPSSYSLISLDNKSILNVPIGNSLFKPPQEDASEYLSFNTYTGLRVKGPAKGNNGSKGFFFDGKRNKVNNTLIGGRFEALDSCIEYSGGWCNTTIGLDLRNSNTGVKYNTSSQLGGWAGSGQLSLSCSYQYNNIGVDESGTPWCNTYINPIFEGNKLGFKAHGDNTVVINPWFELNTTDMELKRGVVFIGGRQVEWKKEAINISSSAKTEAITKIDKKGILITKNASDGVDPILNIDGEGLKELRTPLLGTPLGEAKILSRGYVGGSSVSSKLTCKRLSTQGAYWESRFDDINGPNPESRVIDMTFNLLKSAAGSGLTTGSIEFEVGRFEKVSSNLNRKSVPLIITDRKLTTREDGLTDIGEATKRFNKIYCNQVIQSSPQAFDTPYYKRKMEDRGLYEEYTQLMDDYISYRQQKALIENSEEASLFILAQEEPKPSEELDAFFKEYSVC